MKKKARAPATETQDERFKSLSKKYARKADSLPGWHELAFAEAYSATLKERKVVRREGQAEEEFLAFRDRLFSTETLRGIFEMYRRKRGKKERLIAKLWFLTSNVERIPDYNFPAIARQFRQKLIACEAAHAAVFPFLIYPEPHPKDGESSPTKEVDGALRAADEAIRNLRRSPEAMFAFLKAWRFTRPKGRRPGPSRQNLVMRSIERDFQRRFSKSHLKSILKLVEAAAPEIFYGLPQENKLEALRQRIRSVPVKN